ncbi:MAG TPA: hypothetical protein VGV16_03005 [Gammaproteobacteria bacterium]|nr:hypothetical protein [Gammaproteobacteria bacterium]
MITIAHTLRFAAWSMALLLFMPWANAGGRAPVTGDAAPDMISALQAEGPHASLGKGSELLGRLVGTWNVEYSFHLKNGTVKHQTGEFLAAWVMDGRAVQSLWTVDPHDGRRDREIYTSLHYFDPKSGTWYLTFVDPEHAAPDYQPVARFSGAAEDGDRIVVLTHDFGGKDDRINRWSFDGLSGGSFLFRDEQSSDGGKTWRLLEEDHMTRRGGGADAAAIPDAPRPISGGI